MTTQKQLNFKSSLPMSSFKTLKLSHFNLRTKYDETKVSPFFGSSLSPSLSTSVAAIVSPSMREQPQANKYKKTSSYNSTLVVKSVVNSVAAQTSKTRNKKIYTSYSKLSEVKLLTIGIASPLRILQWAEKTLPNGKIYGEVLNANTLHHKTFKPQKGGLFCERIFGPLKDFECACGKVDKSVKQEFSNSLFRNSHASSALSEAKATKATLLNKEPENPSFFVPKDNQSLPDNKKVNKSIKPVRKFCPDCDVEYTWSVIRRYQLGYIKLISPVTHIWFLKGTPSYLSLLLDIKKRHLQYVTYCSETLTLENSLSQNNKGIFLDSPSKIFSSWQNILSSLSSPSAKKANRSDNLPPSAISSPSGKEEKKVTQSQSTAFSEEEKTSLGDKKDTLIITNLGTTVFNSNRILNTTLPQNGTPSVKRSGTNSSISKRIFKEAIPQKDWKQNQQKNISNDFSNILFEKLKKPVFDSSSSPYPEAVGTATSLPTSSNESIEFAFVAEGNKGNVISYHSKLENAKLINKSSQSLGFMDYRDAKLPKKNVILENSNLIFEQLMSSSSSVPQSGPNQNQKGPSVKRNGNEKSKEQFPYSKLLLDKKEKQINNFLSSFNSLTTKEDSSYAGWSLSQKKNDTTDWNKTSNILTSSFKLTNLLCALQLSLYYNALKINKPKDFFLTKNGFKIEKQTSWALFKNTTKLASTLHTIYNNLPIDLYILCSLEQKVHKQALVSAIKQTWDQLYKKAYLKAMTKAFKITTKYELLFIKYIFENSSSFLKSSDFSLSKTSLSLPLCGTPSVKRSGPNQKGPVLSSSMNQGSEETSEKAKALHNINLEKLNKIFLQKRRFQKKYGNQISMKKIETVLQTLKLSYRQHVLNTLKNLKQPIFSYKYSTSLKNNTNLIIYHLSNDIQNYLSFDIDSMVDLLAQSLLKPLIFAKYLENFKLSSFSFVRGLRGRFAEAAEALRVEGEDNKNSQSLKQSDPLIQDYDTNSPVTNILQLYAKFIRLRSQKRFKNTQSSPLKNPSPLFNVEQVKSYELDKPKNIYFKKYAGKGNLTALKGPSFGYETKTIPSRNNNDIYKKKQNIFNNIYTLSHRERWDTEKDWYIFIMFNSASVDYVDTPIFAYKNRLLSQTNLFSFIQPGNSSLKVPFPNAQRKDQSEAVENDVTALLSRNGPIMEPVSSAFYSGPGIVKQLLNEFDFDEIKKLDKQNRLLLYQLNKSIFKLKKQVQIFVYDKASKLELRELCKKRDLLIRRTKLVRKLFRKDSEPSSMIITVLPVLPPDLRPIVKMGGQIAASDLNRLYQRVIYRNERLKKFLKDPATSNSYEMKYAQRLLQEAVDNLIQNGKSGMNSEKDARGRALKSLSDSLKGKQGRFRQFLLGKRVDYSGRSVIVVGPKLKLHECGLPIEMAKELYLPFLLKSILNKNYAKTVIGAKALIKKNPALAAELLREIMQVSPVLLNRAPTLHRLGFQAFVPKLIEGRAILLHPLVCSAFNADFDGDQMAVHVPITVEARAEAWKLMLSRNNILSPATGEPLAIPSQDMVLGCYYLTTYSNKRMIPNLEGSGLFFNNLQDVMRAYEQKKIHVHALVWVKWTGFIENGNDQEEPVEIRLSNDGQWQEISSNYQRIYENSNLLVNQYMATTPGRILFNTIIQQNIQNK